MEILAENIHSFQQELEKWRIDLNFCKEEIHILGRYLKEVSEKNQLPGMQEEIAFFQQKLAEKMGVPDRFIQEISLYNEQLSNNTATSVTYSLLKEKVDEFCKSYSELKSTFVRFLAKTEITV